MRRADLQGIAPRWWPLCQRRSGAAAVPFQLRPGLLAKEGLINCHPVGTNSPLITLRMLLETAMASLS